MCIRDRSYLKSQKSLSEELMSIRFTAKAIEKLCDMVRSQVDDVRKKERELRRIICLLYTSRCV